MKDQAIAKLTAEMAADTSPYTQAVGAMLIDHINRHPADAAAVLADGKTIKASLKAMESAAREKKTGNCAVLTDREGFEIVLKYYGIGTASAEPAASSSFSVSLDALLD